MIKAPSVFPIRAGNFKIPAWMNENHPVIEYYESLKSAQLHYRTLAAEMNVQCQKAIAGELVNHLLHAQENIYNQYDDSFSSRMYAKATITHIFNRWMEKYGALFKAVGVDLPKLLVDVGDDEIIFINNDSLNKMIVGECSEDFIIGHPATEQAFVTHSIVMYAAEHSENKRVDQTNH